MISLKGKSVLVTGGASGLGLSYAKLLSDRGASVLLNDISSAVHDVAAEIARSGGKAVGYVSDVSDAGA